MLTGKAGGWGAYRSSRWLGCLPVKQAVGVLTGRTDIGVLTGCGGGWFGKRIMSAMAMLRMSWCGGPRDDGGGGGSGMFLRNFSAVRAMLFELMRPLCGGGRLERNSDWRLRKFSCSSFWKCSGVIAMCDDAARACASRELPLSAPGAPLKRADVSVCRGECERDISTMTLPRGGGG